MQPIVWTIMLFKEISRYRIYDRTTISTEHSVIVEARVEFKGTTIFGETGTVDYPVIIELAYLMDQWWICGVSDLF